MRPIGESYCISLVFLFDGFNELVRSLVINFSGDTEVIFVIECDDLVCELFRCILFHRQRHFSR